MQPSSSKNFNFLNFTTLSKQLFHLLMVSLNVIVFAWRESLGLRQCPKAWPLEKVHTLILRSVPLQSESKPPLDLLLSFTASDFSLELLLPSKYRLSSRFEQRFVV